MPDKVAFLYLTNQVQAKLKRRYLTVEEKSRILSGKQTCWKKGKPRGLESMSHCQSHEVIKLNCKLILL